MPLRSSKWQRHASEAMPHERTAGFGEKSPPPPLRNADRWSEAIRRGAIERGSGETAVVDLWSLNASSASADRRDGGMNWDAAGLAVVAGNGFALLTHQMYANGMPEDWESPVRQA